MSDENSVPLTSLNTRSIVLKCTFINHDGVDLVIKVPSSTSIRHLKKRIIKNLTNPEVARRPKKQESPTKEDVIYVSSEVTEHTSASSTLSTTSTRSSVSESIKIEGNNFQMSIRTLGGDEQQEELIEIIRSNPDVLLNARLFCMGKELKSNQKLKRNAEGYRLT